MLGPPAWWWYHLELGTQGLHTFVSLQRPTSIKTHYFRFICPRCHFEVWSTTLCLHLTRLTTFLQMLRWTSDDWSLFTHSHNCPKSWADCHGLLVACWLFSDKMYGLLASCYNDEGRCDTKTDCSLASADQSWLIFLHVNNYYRHLWISRFF